MSGFGEKLAHGDRQRERDTQTKRQRRVTIYRSESARWASDQKYKILRQMHTRPLYMEYPTGNIQHNLGEKCNGDSLRIHQALLTFFGNLSNSPTDLKNSQNCKTHYLQQKVLSIKQSCRFRRQNQ